MEPSASSDAIVKFTAGITAAVTLIADLDNLQDLYSVRIQVFYLFVQYLFAIGLEITFEEVAHTELFHIAPQPAVHDDDIEIVTIVNKGPFDFDRIQWSTFEIVPGPLW